MADMNYIKTTTTAQSQKSKTKNSSVDVVEEETAQPDKTIGTKTGSSRKQLDSTIQESLASLKSSSLGSLAAPPDDVDRLPRIFASTSTLEEGLNCGAIGDANQKSSSLVSPANVPESSLGPGAAELAHKLDPAGLAGACANELVDGLRNNVNNGALKGDVMMNKLERKGCAIDGGGGDGGNDYDDAFNSSVGVPDSCSGDGAEASRRGSQTGQAEGQDEMGRDSVRTTSSSRLDIDESEPEQVVDSEVEFGLGKEKERVEAIKRQMGSENSGIHQHKNHDYSGSPPEEEQPLNANRRQRLRSDRRGFSMQITNRRKFSDNCSLCRYLISVREAADSKEASVAKHLAESRMAQRAGQQASMAPEVGAVRLAEVLGSGNNNNDMKLEEGPSNQDSSESRQCQTLFHGGQSASWDHVKKQSSTFRNDTDKRTASFLADEFGTLCNNALLRGDNYKFEFRADQIIKRETHESIGCDKKVDRVANDSGEMHSEGSSSKQSIVFNASSAQVDNIVEQNRTTTDSDQVRNENDEMLCEQTDRDLVGSERANKPTAHFMKSFNRRSMKIFRGLSLDGNKQLSLNLKRINSRLTLGQKKKSQSTKLIVINSENASYTIQGKFLAALDGARDFNVRDFN